MTFMKDLLLTTLKSLIVAVVLSVIVMSLIQSKFPPSYDETRELIQSAKKAFEIGAAMKAESSLLTSRQNLFNEMKKLDSTTEDHPIAAATAENEKMPTLRYMNRRLDQAEYKIRVLEFEMKQLKDEYKKLKSSGANPNRN